MASLRFRILPVSSPGLLYTLRSFRLLIERFGFARAPRDKYCPEGTRGLGQNHLVGQALIGTQRSFGGEEVRSHALVFVCRADPHQYATEWAILDQVANRFGRIR